MKYVILVGDGMADRPLDQLGGKTPLEAAKTPNMDFIASSGTSGIVQTIPHGMKPGSDIANLALLGYDPKKYFMGRGPLEALSIGVELKSDEVAFRCNTVKVEKGKMKDFSAGHIKTVESAKLIKLLDRELGNKGIKFHPGVSYRHICIIKNGPLKAQCTPPHDITGQEYSKYLPKGPGADILNILMSDSQDILSAVSSRCNMVWLWGQGKKPKMPKFPLKGSVITAVDLIKGIAKATGLKVIKVPGVTGYLDTNYIGKAKYALKSLENNDFVFVHVESPDEAGHEGNIKHKIKAIEDFDRFVVGTVLKGLKNLALSGAEGFREYKILVLPDHATPIAIKTHSSEPVPFALLDTSAPSNCSCCSGCCGVRGYSEKQARSTGTLFKSGPELIKYFLKP